MDIYLKEKSNSNARFRFPSLPETAKVKNTTNYQSYDIIGKGSVKIPKGMDSGNLSWSHVFFGQKHTNGLLGGVWIAPTECIKIIQDWQQKGTVLNLMVTETAINKDVTIKSFDFAPIGAAGDYEYDISFEEYRELKAYTTDELKIESYVKKVVARPAPEPSRQHTIVYGDTLWGLAQKYYGNGALWTKIFDANAETLDNDAKKWGRKNSNKGNWIWPGTVITIP